MEVLIEKVFEQLTKNSRSCLGKFCSRFSCKSSCMVKDPQELETLRKSKDELITLILKLKEQNKNLTL